MTHLRKARLTAGILLGVGALVAPLAGASGALAASSPGPNTPTTVPAGISAATLPGATVFGNTPADTPVTVSFILKEQNIPPSCCSGSQLPPVLDSGSGMGAVGRCQARQKRSPYPSGRL